MHRVPRDPLRPPSKPFFASATSSSSPRFWKRTRSATRKDNSLLTLPNPVVGLQPGNGFFPASEAILATLRKEMQSLNTAIMLDFNPALKFGYDLLDRGLIPDFVLRPTIRALCKQRLQAIDYGSFEANHAAKMQWIESVRARETIADSTQKANEQHYEVSTKFILSCLGPYAKYSACLYPKGNEPLEEAEVLMLESYCEKAQLKDGIAILDLGCGWGSLSIYLAEKYPNSQIVGLSNSATQKAYIEYVACAKNLSNIKIITGDVNHFEFDTSIRFDRILSIEMFEHMKNYDRLMNKIASWLRPTSSENPNDALLFVHLFCHKTMPYHFEERDGWMAKTFFTGGTMPSHDLLTYFQSDLILTKSWYVNGKHYSRTLEDWLRRQDKSAKESILELERDAESKGLDKKEGRKAFHRFRVFYMACSELFNMHDGQEWGIGHYLFKLKPAVRE